MQLLKKYIKKQKKEMNRFKLRDQKKKIKRTLIVHSFLIGLNSERSKSLFSWFIKNQLGWLNRNHLQELAHTIFNQVR